MHPMTILYSLIASVVIMSGSLAGVLFTSNTLGAWMRPRISYLATFSAGVLSVLSYHLITEALENASSLTVIVVSVTAGIIILEIIHGLVPDAHHHHEATDHAHSEVDGRRVLISDGIHNITDGFLIVSAFLAGWQIGVAATIAIFFHECVQEISQFFVLKHAGYSDRRALLSNLAASSTILIGVGIAVLFATSGILISVLSAVAAGGFLSVVVRDLVPHAVDSARTSGHWFPHTFAIVTGAALMLTIDLAIPH